MDMGFQRYASPTDRLFMNRYTVRAVSPTEGVVEHVVSAQNSQQARSLVERSGWRVIKVESSAGQLLRWPFRRSQARFRLQGFVQEFLALLEAGMGAVEAIDVLAGKARDNESELILSDLRRAVSEGKSLSVAAEAQPQVFPILFVATLRSSERTGDLPRALRRYLAYLQQVNLVRNKIIGASLYPAVLMGVSGLLMIFLMGFVVPRFSRIYADMGDRIPLPSRMMVHWGNLVEAQGMWIGVCALIFTWAVAMLLARPSVQQALLSRIQILPGIGERLRLYQLARFTRTLAMLQSGGIPFVPALGMTQDLLHQPELRVALSEAQRRISEGAPVSIVFSEAGLATEVGVRLLIVGERSGDLAAMLERIANLYDQELERAVEWFSRLLEPVMMMVVGAVIGVVILLMYLPIFELANLTK